MWRRGIFASFALLPMPSGVGIAAGVFSRWQVCDVVSHVSSFFCEGGYS